MQNMTHRDAVITKNYIVAHQKINFSDQNLGVKKSIFKMEIFSLEIQVKKIFFKMAE